MHESGSETMKIEQSEISLYENVDSSMLPDLTEVRLVMSWIIIRFLLTPSPFHTLMDSLAIFLIMILFHN